MNELNFSVLIGKVIAEILNTGTEVHILCNDGSRYKMFHQQDCCEGVCVEDIIGDLNDLIGSPITEAEEVSSHENPEGVEIRYQDSFTWTFYKLGTIKGHVTIRWYGESNGYYSESVTFCQN
jgi:uncharacterized protein YegJ (DUF2314 family)